MPLGGAPFENRAGLYAAHVLEARKLRPQVILLGLVSLLNDSASEMIYPLLPVFLTTTLGATPLIVGLIEGSADALASILKLVAGTMAERPGRAAAGPVRQRDPLRAARRDDRRCHARGEPREGLRILQRDRHH